MTPIKWNIRSFKGPDKSAFSAYHNHTAAKQSAMMNLIIAYICSDITHYMEDNSD